MDKSTQKKKSTNKKTSSTASKARKTLPAQKNRPAPTSKTKKQAVTKNPPADETVVIEKPVPLEVRLIGLLFASIALILSMYFDAFGILGRGIKQFFGGFFG